ncbi:MAG: asparagine synthetase B, partial [Bacteroidota bacterium]
PLKQILLSGLNSEMADLLNEERIQTQKIFSFDGIQSLLKKLNSSNPENSAQQVWSLLVFQKFYLNYFKIS